MTTNAVPDTTTRVQRADARRNAALVLEAARTVLAAEGPDASLEEIARQAGVGIGTLYRHYPNRQVLLSAVFREDLDRARARADDLVRSATPIDGFTTWMHDQLAMARGCRGLAASVIIAMLDEDDDEPPMCEAMRASGAVLLERAQSAGDVRADATIDDLLRMVNAIAIATEDAPDGADQAERMFALVMDGVCVRPVPAGRSKRPARPGRKARVR